MPGEIGVTAAANGGSAAFVGPPDSSIHTKLKLPPDTGSAGQVLKVKSANHSSTNAELEWAADAGGKILQVKQTVKTDVTSTTSSTFEAISGLSVDITPSSASSKILITVDTKIGNAGAGAYIKLVRDSTDIYKGDSGGVSCLQETYGGSDTGEGYYGSPYMGGTYLDTPSYTLGDTLTYAVHWKRENAVTLYLNRTGYDTSPYNGRSASSITVMEIAA